jgi:hypothetical protein
MSLILLQKSVFTLDEKGLTICNTGQIVQSTFSISNPTPRGLEDAGSVDGVKVYHAGTRLDDNGVMQCNGGRVLAVTGTGPSLAEALAASYKAVDQIKFVDNASRDDGLMHRRTDIAKGAVRRKLRIGVLGSTRGTSLVPVMEACANGTLHAEIVAVVSDRSSTPILDKGRSLGVTVTTKFLSAKGLSRDQYDAECTSMLVGVGVEYVLLVGYMRILSKGFADYWAGRCINVHPSLLPKHSGRMDLAVSSLICPTAPYSDLAHFQLLFLNHFRLSSFLGDE